MANAQKENVKNAKLASMGKYVIKNVLYFVKEIFVTKKMDYVNVLIIFQKIAIALNV